MDHILYLGLLLQASPDGMFQVPYIALFGHASAVPHPTEDNDHILSMGVSHSFLSWGPSGSRLCVVATMAMHKVQLASRTT